MALIFADGFDANDLNLKWIPLGNCSANAGTRFGTGLSCLGNNVGFMKRYTVGTAQMFMGFACYLNGSNSSMLVIFQGDNGITSNNSVVLAPNLISLKAGNNGSTLSSAFLPTYGFAAWHYIEIMETLASSGGQCQVKVDGVTVLTFTGNTLQGGTGTTIDCTFFNLSVNAGNTFIDDLYMCDATGATNNTFLGDVRVQTLLPTGAGSSTQFSPTGSVNNWQNVDDVPDSSTTYNSSSTVAQRDTYVMGQLLAGTGTIFGTQTNIHAFKQNSGSANIKAALKSSATIVYDTTQILDPTNTWSAGIHQTDPNTSAAWTTTGLNAIEFGAEVA